MPDHRAMLDAIKRGDAEARAPGGERLLLDGAEKDAMNGIRLPAPAVGSAAARSMSQ